MQNWPEWGRNKICEFLHQFYTQEISVSQIYFISIGDKENMLQMVANRK